MCIEIYLYEKKTFYIRTFTWATQFPVHVKFKIIYVGLTEVFEYGRIWK